MTPPVTLPEILAFALVGFAGTTAGYHLPTLVPALRRVVRPRR